jgi:hypothetical protein
MKMRGGKRQKTLQNILRTYQKVYGIKKNLCGSAEVFRLH